MYAYNQILMLPFTNSLNLNVGIGRRQIERSKLAREKQLREAAEREKAVLEQKLMEYQEEIRLAKEALVRSNHSLFF